MKLRRSVFALVAGVVLVAQAVSFLMTRDSFIAQVRQAEAEKVEAAGGLVSAFVNEFTHGVRFTASSLSVANRLSRALTEADVAEGNRLLVERLTPVAGKGGVDVIEVVDRRGIVRFRSDDPATVGTAADVWGISEALAGRSMLVTHTTPGASTIVALEPLRADGEVVGALIAGRRIDDDLLKSMAAHLKGEIALFSAGRLVAASSAKAANAHDPAAVAEAFREKRAVSRQFANGQFTTVYQPQIIVDDAYVLQLTFDSSAAYQRLEDGLWRMLQFTGALLVFSLVASLVLLTRFLRPLRELRERAEQTALQTLGAPIDPGRGGEITSVVHVLDSLTERLVERNQALEAAQTQAKAASDAKTQFLSAMSHEIRTPLNGVLGMAELLRETQLTADQRRYSEAISSSGRALHELLSDILDVGKIEAGRVEIERLDFDLRRLFTDLLTAFRELSATRSNRLEVDLRLPGNARVRGDATRLRQVISNLVGNANKFTQGGTIAVRVSAMPTRAGDSRAWYRFEVSDTGIGIEPEKLENLFQPFVQADASIHRQFGGTGLGLVISKHLVELLGGSIDVASEPGVGTRFGFELPFEPAAEPAAAPTPVVVRRRLDRLRVLLAEDNKINEDVITAMLVQAGATVRCVVNGEFAVQALRVERFDLVLMDCQMPVMDGLQATRMIRDEQGDEARVPIIALTANAFQEDRQRCLAAGMDDFLSKPVQRDALLETIARWTTASPAPVSTTPSTPPQAAAPSTSSAPAAPPVIPGIAAPGRALPTLDRGVLDALAGEVGDEIVASTARLFVSRMDDEIAQLRQSGASDDRAALRLQVHALKSSAGTLGGLAASAVAADLETRLRAGEALSGERLEALCSALQALRDPLLSDAETRVPKDAAREPEHPTAGV